MGTRVLQIVGSVDLLAIAEPLRVWLGRAERAEFDDCVVVLTPLPAWHEPRDWFPTILSSCGLHNALDWQAWRRFRQLVTSTAPDLLHFRGCPPSTVAGLLGYLGWTGPVVVSGAGLAEDLSEPNNRLISGLVRRRLRRCRSLTFAAAGPAGHWSHFVGEDSIMSVPQAVASPTGAAMCAREFRRFLRVPDDARLLACVAPLERSSALRDLIWAVDVLRVVRSDVYLVIAGQGVDRPGLHRFTELIEMSDRVRWLPEDSAISRWLPAVDVYVQPAASRELPIGMLLALSAARPIVAADSAAARQLVSSSPAARLVDVGDRAALARESQRLLDDQALAAKLSAGARALADARYAPTSLVTRLAGVYRHALSGR